MRLPDEPYELADDDPDKNRTWGFELPIEWMDADEMREMIPAEYIMESDAEDQADREIYFP